LLQGGENVVRKSFVDKYYEMDPKTEDLLFDGTYISEGMVVLIQSPSYKETLIETSVSNGKYDEIWRAKKYNRWCTVSDVKSNERGIVSFIGVYEDGTKRKHCHDVFDAWIVKKDSIPEPEHVSSVDEIVSAFDEVRDAVHRTWLRAKKDNDDDLVVVLDDLFVDLRKLQMLFSSKEVLEESPNHFEDFIESNQDYFTHPDGITLKGAYARYVTYTREKTNREPGSFVDFRTDLTEYFLDHCDRAVEKKELVLNLYSGFARYFLDHCDRDVKNEEVVRNLYSEFAKKQEPISSHIPGESVPGER
jgi:hypothetical protein